MYFLHQCVSCPSLFDSREMTDEKRKCLLCICPSEGVFCPHLNIKTWTKHRNTG